jgi:hypothetical protein
MGLRAFCQLGDGHENGESGNRISPLTEFLQAVTTMGLFVGAALAANGESSAIRYSLFSTRHSLFAICCLPDLPICPSHGLPSSISSPNGLRHNYDSAFGKEAA